MNGIGCALLMNRRWQHDPRLSGPWGVYERERVMAETIEQFAVRIVADVRKGLLDRIDDDVIGHLGKSHIIFAQACVVEAIATAMREAKPHDQ